MPDSSVRFVRPARDQLRQVAALRWASETAGGRATQLSEPEFVAAFERWWDEHGHTHRCLVGVDSADRVAAYGFVAITSRVPGPNTASRCSADVQTVFVVPELRDRGFGGRLVEGLLDLARDAGAEHVTVHSSVRAVSVYERAGFAVDPLLLNQVLG